MGRWGRNTLVGVMRMCNGGLDQVVVGEVGPRRLARGRELELRFQN